MRWRFQGREERLDARSLQVFTSHFSLMSACGFPIVSILEVIGRSEGALGEACRRLGLDIFRGSSLSQAMSLQPRNFPESYIHVVRVGETSGRLSECLATLASTLERREQLLKLLFHLLIYPLTLLVVCVLLVGVAVYGIFPMIIKVTAASEEDLPGLTRLLMTIASGEVMAALCGVILLLAVGFAAVWRHPTYSRIVRGAWEELTPLGHFQVRTRLVICIRQLALLMECGIDLTRSIRLLREIASGSLLLERAFTQLEGQLREGEDLAKAMAEHDVFPGFLTSMIAAGSESANISNMLNRVADTMEEELYRSARTVAALAEPVLIGFLGLGVGTVILAALLPIYGLVNV